MTAHSVGDASLGAGVWRQRWLALGVLIVVLVAVAGWLRSAPRSYTASATIAATPVASMLQSAGNFETLEATLAQIANSQSVLEGVSARLKETRTFTQLRNEVRGTYVTGTVLIRVTVTDSDPKAAADIANAVAAVLPVYAPSGRLFVFTQTDPARVPTTYSSPNTKIIVLAGIALGLLVALGIASLYDRLAGTVDTVDQSRDSTGTGGTRDRAVSQGPVDTDGRTRTPRPTTRPSPRPRAVEPLRAGERERHPDRPDERIGGT